MSLAYYPLYPRDFETDERVRLMSLSALGLYFSLLNLSWINDGVPENPSDVLRILRINARDFRRVWAEVEPCFPICEDGRRRNLRQEEERLRADRLVEKNTKNGKLGGRPRKPTALLEENPSLSSGFDLGSIRACDSDYDSDSKKKNLPCEISILGSAGWAEFLAAWCSPCRWCGVTFSARNVDNAARVWLSLNGSKPPLAEILAAVERWKASDDWHRDGGRFVPALDTWLGFSRDGRPAAPRWSDHPKAADSHTAEYLPETQARGVAA